MSGFIFSPRLDALAFGGATLLSLALTALGAATGLLDADPLPWWVFLVAIVGVDVAHVWGNLLLVYTDPALVRAHPVRAVALPLVVVVIGLALVTEHELWFWRALAAAAVFHFVRQQVGWVKLARARRDGAAEEHALARLVDEGTVYAVTVGPVLWWHANLPRAFSWLIADDFFIPVPHGVGTAALVVEALALAAYAIGMVLRARAGRAAPTQDLVVLSTALLWNLGIVVLDSDFAFTVTNVFHHGIPYFVLIVVTARKRRAAGASLSPLLARGALGITAALLVCAVVEETLWDRLVWHAHDLAPLPAVDVGAWRPLVVVGLAVPQAVHYLLDGFIWRRREGLVCARGGRR